MEHNIQSKQKIFGILKFGTKNKMDKYAAYFGSLTGKLTKFKIWCYWDNFQANCIHIILTSDNNWCGVRYAGEDCMNYGHFFTLMLKT